VDGGMCASHRSTIARKLFMTWHPLFDDTTQRPDTSTPLIVAHAVCEKHAIRHAAFVANSGHTAHVCCHIRQQVNCPLLHDATHRAPLPHAR
jgi:hypothetical protein